MSINKLLQKAIDNGPFYGPEAGKFQEFYCYLPAEGKVAVTTNIRRWDGKWGVGGVEEYPVIKAISCEWQKDSDGYGEYLKAVLNTGHALYGTSKNFLIQEIERFCSERGLLFDYSVL